MVWHVGNVVVVPSNLLSPPTRSLLALSQARSRHHTQACPPIVGFLRLSILSSTFLSPISSYQEVMRCSTVPNHGLKLPAFFAFCVATCNEGKNWAQTTFPTPPSCSGSRTNWSFSVTNEFNKINSANFYQRFLYKPKMLNCRYNYCT